VRETSPQVVGPNPTQGILIDFGTSHDPVDELQFENMFFNLEASLEPLLAFGWISVVDSISKLDG